jgi:catechol 2,3-dioxygenase-like lactoylglutathione lyase family enzyme
MSTVESSTFAAQPAPAVEPGAIRLEVAAIPISNIDRAKDFYVEKLGWRLDADMDVNDDFRVLQVTPPGSPCSIHFGRGITSNAPGCADHMYLVVCDIRTARDALVARGVDVGEIFHVAPGGVAGPGVDPDHCSYQSYAPFSDPDGNRWMLQEITTRLPGR